MFFPIVLLGVILQKATTSHQPSPYQPCLGLSNETAASSCQEIYHHDPAAPSGYYWITTPTNVTLQVYCEMTEKCCIHGGWMRAGYINMGDPTATCPNNLRTVSASPKTLCGRTISPGCSSVFFHINGLPFNKVCGRAVGYQYYSMDAFERVVSGATSIDSPYVDGISITHGTPRKHIFTYAVGLSDDEDDPFIYNCPCAKFPGSAAPEFVKGNYFCESGMTGHYSSNNFISINDPLWDGQGCLSDNNCCAQSGAPWFLRNIPDDITDDIEMRLCSDQVIANEDVLLELMEIYVQ